MIGSLLRQSGLGLDRFTHPLVGSLHSPTMNPVNGMLSSQPLTNCFTTDDGSGNPVTMPASPVYACFHDQVPTGYYGTATSGVTRTIRLPANMEFGMPVSSSSAGLIGLSTLGTGARSVEYCSEDTEVASSGRQSGKDYCTVR
ncbi:unnamed protein product [Echinostoma caproni]|uniref:Homeobox protein araucan n=1 Tax=Echinostoma caproni TaxID=27848 RepID=A0A183B153_9TREM|nr:unnamed protein product [Echinostoma caproni]